MLAGFDHGVATLVASLNVTRFTPALIIPELDLNLGLDRFYQALRSFKI